MGKQYPCGQLSVHFLKLLEALHHVGSSYMNIDPNLNELQIERCFAYEFYHQWRNQISDERYKQKFPGITLNGEISKSIDGSASTYPDMVLHSGQNNRDGNYIVCEIKRNKTDLDAVKEDLIKLSKYLGFVTRYFDNKLRTIQYDDAVFIMFGIDFNKLKSKIVQMKEELKREIEIEKQSKIKIISVKSSANNINDISFDILENILN